MPNLSDIEKWFDGRIPKTLSSPGDSDGFSLRLSRKSPVTRAVAALDVTSGAINYAREAGAELIVTHHQLIYDPLKRLDGDESVGRRLINAVSAGISLFAMHTRLDAAEGGVNDCLCSLLGLKKEETTFADGCGRVGTLSKPLSAEDFAGLAKRLLGAENMSFVSCGRPVSRIAVLGGGGKNYLSEAAATGADSYLTGEVNHSALLEARELGLNLFLGTHYSTEAVVLPKITALIKEGFPEIEVFEYYEKIYN